MKYRTSPCCDMHNQHCEPPSELCCCECTEVAHPAHPDGEACVLAVAQAIYEAHGEALMDDLYRDWPGEPGLDFPESVRHA